MPEHTISENLQRLQTARTAIGNAITAKGGTVNSGDGLEEYATDIATIPSGGSVSVPSKDVNFYDYDGTIVASYTASEFAELSAMPANPSHTGLTAQGWNWSLSDAKDYVADYGMLDIGQMYASNVSNGKTKIYITLSEGRLTPYLGFTGAVSGTTATIDWGDESNTETVSLGTSTVYTPHTYTIEGDYIISVNVDSGKIIFAGNNTYGSDILRKSGSPNANDDKVYQNSIVKIEIGNSVTSIGGSAFYNCSSLQSITIPNSVTSIGDGAFYNCSSLQSITIPNSVTSIGGSAFNGCRSLQSITIPDSVTNIGNYLFQDCNALQSITIPNSVTSIGGSAFQNCYSLTSVTISDLVTRIGGYAFNSCRSLQSVTISDLVTSIGGSAFGTCNGLGFIKFTSTTPPSIANINAWTGIPSDCYILVPYDTLDDYLNETNMPDDSVYPYLCYAKYADGVSLPTQDSDGYALTWYATKEDARNGTNPITVGNGKEIYAVGV